MDNNYLAIHQYRLDWLLKYISRYRLSSSSAVLDLGCYPPYLFDHLKTKYSVWGISSQHEPLIDHQIKTVNLETDNLPFSDNYFDLIICSEVIEHLGGGLASLFSEVSRCLKPGGRFLLTTPNVLRLHNVFSLIVGRNIYFPLFQLDSHPNFRHQREYTKNELLDLAKNTRLEISNFCFLAAYPPYRPHSRSQGFFIQLFKWFFYLLLLAFPSRRDTLVFEFTKP